MGFYKTHLKKKICSQQKQKPAAANKWHHNIEEKKGGKKGRPANLLESLQPMAALSQIEVT